jgi:phytol kinase
VSREGDPRELLRGPLYYVVVMVFCTVLFWRDSPLSIIALAMMCAGDGGLHLQHKTILLKKSCHIQV